MSGIAELLLNLGYRVSGSDLRESETTRRLSSLGADIFVGHKANWVQGVDVVVSSSAIPSDNPEIVAAIEAHTPIIQRAEMLAELMRLDKYGIAVAGSHGKTSTTSIVSHVMAEAGLDPTVVVGGKVDSLGGNAKLGCGDYLVAEADESDGSFLKLSPAIEVITNIDLEHLDYYKDIEEIKEIFISFTENLPFYGVAVVCLDDDNLARIIPRIRRRIITYGFTEQADLYADDIRREKGVSVFNVFYKGKKLGRVEIKAPGWHNIYNSLAAIGVSLELGLDFAAIKKGLSNFAGVQRRLQVKGEVADILFIDDYGHHPTEIKATLDAVRDGWPGRRIVVLFQPHRYSRTRDLFVDFQTSFHRADVLYVCDIYSAGEKPVMGISSEVMVKEMSKYGQKNVHYLPADESLVNNITKMLEPGDLFLTLGAGDVFRTGEQLMQSLQK